MGKELEKEEAFEYTSNLPEPSKKTINPDQDFCLNIDNLRDLIDEEIYYTQISKYGQKSTIIVIIREVNVINNALITDHARVECDLPPKPGYLLPDKLTVNVTFLGTSHTNKPLVIGWFHKGILTFGEELEGLLAKSMTVKQSDLNIIDILN